MRQSSNAFAYGTRDSVVHSIVARSRGVVGFTEAEAEADQLVRSVSSVEIETFFADLS